MFNSQSPFHCKNGMSVFSSRILIKYPYVDFHTSFETQLSHTHTVFAFQGLCTTAVAMVLDHPMMHSGTEHAQ